MFTDGGDCIDISDIRRVAKSGSCVFGACVWGFFTRRARYTSSFSGVLPFHAFVQILAQESRLASVLAQVVVFIGTRLEKQILVDNEEPTPGKESVLRLSFLSAEDQLSKRACNLRLAMYVSSCVEIASQHTFISYAQDKSHPRKMPVVNGAISLSNNYVLLCCPIVAL